MTAFFDTNVLVYAVGDDQPMADLAWRRLDQGGVISVQVLNELVAVLRGKMKQPWEVVDQVLKDVAALGLEVVSVTPGVQQAAVEIARNHHLHIYDATIIASARHANCDVLWSEDMADGHRLGALTVRNPFKEA